MSRVGPLHANDEKVVECPKCGSPDIHRSKRSWMERSLNWVFFYHQRPFHCSTCKNRFWVRLEPHVWRRMMRYEMRLTLRRLKWYLVVFVLAAVVSLFIIEYEGGLTAFEEKVLEVWENTDLTHPEQR